MGSLVKKHPFVEILERYMPDVKEKLNDGINISQIKEVEHICGKLLPNPFVKLYEAANGEKAYVGTMLGFDWLSIEEIISSHKSLMDSASINISNKPWFDPFSMIYAGAIKAMEIVKNPGEALNGGAGRLKEAASGFFRSIKTKISETAGSIKEKIMLLGQPSRQWKQYRANPLWNWYASISPLLTS